MSLKRALIGGVDRVLAMPGVSGALRNRARRGLTILMYHKVLPDEIAGEYPLRNLVVSRTNFERHVRWIAANASACTLAEASGGVEDGRTPRVCVTFDDGYLDNAEIAAPILDHAGIRATFFVTTSFVAGTPMWFDIAAHAYLTLGARGILEAITSRSSPELTSLGGWLAWLKRLDANERESVVASLDGGGLPSQGEPGNEVFGAMRPGDLAALARRGHEIGSHTVTHPILTRCDDPRLRHELVASKSEIEAWIGDPVRSLCYPNGDADERVVRAAREAGYTTACTTVRGMNPPRTDPLRLRRRFITDESAGDADAFAGEALGVHDALRRGMGRG